ncbi:YdcF family protein [Corynebacterium sp. TAE3-ERU30]|uniref:YdcF family protein n=1 Tax=Corynebacterium sp. TAE3-ERU30 TaxID=2849496 RepID=UPI001C487755|nr:YdcF family protein [Corynebacterium sp. TAE3-ERU30]
MSPQPRPVVVLGASVEQAQPRRPLERRLRAALVPGRAAIARGDVVVVTGRDEAPVMAQWLAEHGIDRASIVLEDRAESTNENLEHVRELLREHYGREDIRYVVVSNRFHLPRIRLWAWHHGYAVETIGAPTPFPEVLWLCLREAGALAHSALRIVWRKLKPILAAAPQGHRGDNQHEGQ